MSGLTLGVAWFTIPALIFLLSHVLGRQVRDVRSEALAEIADPLSLGFTPEEAAARLDGIEGYRLQFDAVFGGPPTGTRIAKALAAFERTVLSGASKWDYHEQAWPHLDQEPEEDDDPDFLARRAEILAARWRAASAPPR